MPQIEHFCLVNFMAKIRETAARSFLCRKWGIKTNCTNI